MVTNIRQEKIVHFSGGIGFRFYNCNSTKALKIVLKVYRQDAVCEYFLLDTNYCEDIGNGWQKWQSHQLPLFPYDGHHGNIREIHFAYIVHCHGVSIPSQHDYKFATFADFERGYIDADDYEDKSLHNANKYITYELDCDDVQKALQRINDSHASLSVSPFFTRGGVHSHHPLPTIHRLIDRVIERKWRKPRENHYIHIAMYDFDHYHIAEHLIYAHQNGVQVECLADWAFVSALHATDNIARMRRAGIMICGIVRNTPCNPDEGIASMHTKIIIFDGEIVHSSSYNLHFHIWGGNWENALLYASREVATLYANIYHAIRGGVIQKLIVEPTQKYNLYYSFGRYATSTRAEFSPQDAIIAEINAAEHSIIVCMFDIGFLQGYGQEPLDVVSALIQAQQRGVKVTIMLNGTIACDLQQTKTQLRPPLQQLQDAQLEVLLIYYWENALSPIHHKFAIFDEYTVMTESYNWYIASIYSDDVFSVTRDRDLARAFIDECQYLLKKFRSLRLPLKK